LVIAPYAAYPYPYYPYPYYALLPLRLSLSVSVSRVSTVLDPYLGYPPY
jgi:hypothetical protein